MGCRRAGIKVAGARIARGQLTGIVGWTGDDRSWARLLLDDERRVDVAAFLPRMARSAAELWALAAAALAGVLAQPVGHQDMVLVARRGHPAVKRGLGARAYAALDHVLVAPRGFQGGVIDTALEKLGLARRVVVRVTHFSAAAFTVASTDLVVALPECFARAMAEVLPLAVDRKSVV